MVRIFAGDEVYKAQLGLQKIKFSFDKRVSIKPGCESSRVFWITQLGKNFIHVVFPFKEAYDDNLCFIKMAQVPGDNTQFNHHSRMLHTADINEEVIGYMNRAYDSHMTRSHTIISGVTTRKGIKL